MDIGIRSRLKTGFAVVSVGALVMTPVVAGQVAQARLTPDNPPVVMLTAVAQPLPAPRLLTQPTTLAPLHQLASIQPLDPLVQQVGFHIAFVADFLTTGAVLFAREFATPGAVLNDIHNGVPVPAAVGRALQTFAQIELEAGREVVGFAAEYVSFQLNFFANLVRLPFAAVGTLLSGLTPASATQAAVASSGSEAVLQTRQSTPHEPTAAATSDEATTTGQSGVETNQRVRDPRTSTSSLADTVTDQAKKFRSSVAKSESVIGTTAKTHDEDTDAVASNQAGGTRRPQRPTAGPV
jgi:hypothetical protein